jgi:rhodanese-related sulfurtransferase
LVPVLAAAVLLGAAAPAAPPDYPVRFIASTELKTRLDRGETVEIIDVRSRPEYEELHIRGARSIPLSVIRERAREVGQSAPVVLY